MARPIERGKKCECGKDHWWDNSKDKKNPNAPDYKCAECGFAEWIKPLKTVNSLPKSHANCLCEQCFEQLAKMNQKIETLIAKELQVDPNEVLDKIQS